jgi:hypothetical protein
MHRDLGEWDRLRDLFHPDGTIEVTWFEGNFNESVDGSMRMGASDLRTKHLISTPVVAGPKNVMAGGDCSSARASTTGGRSRSRGDSWPSTELP